MFFTQKTDLNYILLSYLNTSFLALKDAICSVVRSNSHFVRYLVCCKKVNNNIVINCSKVVLPLRWTAILGYFYFLGTNTGGPKCRGSS